MKEYLMTLMSVSLLNGIIHMISPEGDIKKYVRLLGALCLLCAIAVPIFAALSEGGPDLSFLSEIGQEAEQQNYDEIYQNTLIQSGEAEAAKVMKNRMIQELSMKNETFDVSVEFVSKNDDIVLGNVTVLLRDSAIFTDPRQVIDWVNEVYQCPCIIVYE